MFLCVKAIRSGEQRINVHVNWKMNQMFNIPWLPNGQMVSPFSVRFAALLLPIVELCGGNTSMIAFSAPTRGTVTFFNMGKLFFAAYFWLTSRRFRRKPPSGKRTIQRRSNGINVSRKWCFKFSIVASRVLRPWWHKTYFGF